MKKSEKNPSAQVDKLIAGLTDWRGKRFEEIRAINERALKALVRKAVGYNQANRKGKATKAR